MTHTVYVNGRYLDYADAAVHVEDRGFQFSDGVYEVCEIRDGNIIEERGHLLRLQRSLGELGIAPPMSMWALGLVMRETVRRNRVREGLVYLQITRGVARRDFAFPGPEVAPTVVCFARRLSRGKLEGRAAHGIAVITVPDIRWKRVDIKTVGLLAQSMARQKAKEAGAEEAWMVSDDGYVTEGASCNAWIVTAAGEIVTRHIDGHILRGITREATVKFAKEQGLRLVERPFTPEEAKNAREAFQTSATGLIMPVVKIDGKIIGDGRPGPVTLALRKSYIERAEQTGPRRFPEGIEATA